MFEVMLLLGTMVLGLMLACELETCVKTQYESTDEKIERLECKVDEILDQIKELKEQK